MQWKPFFLSCMTYSYFLSFSFIPHHFNKRVQFPRSICALGAGLRTLPSLCVGFLIQMTTGLIIHCTSPFFLALATLLSSCAPLLMAVTSTRWPYWYAAFPAQLLAPMACDILLPSTCWLCQKYCQRTRRPWRVLCSILWLRLGQTLD